MTFGYIKEVVTWRYLHTGEEEFRYPLFFKHTFSIQSIMRMEIAK